MTANCTDEGGVWNTSWTNRREFDDDGLCLCPTYYYSPSIDLALALVVFFILAMTVAFGLFTLTKTVSEARLVKQNTRRLSEQEHQIFSSTGRSGPVSTSSVGEVAAAAAATAGGGDSVLRRESAYPISSVYPRTNLTPSDASEMYEELLPQYVITPIPEAEDYEMEMMEGLGEQQQQRLSVPFHDHRRSGGGGRGGGGGVDTNMRSDSVNSDQGAERLFRLIFEDPQGSVSGGSTSRGGNSGVEDNDLDEEEEDHHDGRSRLEIVSSAVETFHRVRHSIWRNANSSAASLLDVETAAAATATTTTKQQYLSPPPAHPPPARIAQQRQPSQDLGRRLRIGRRRSKKNSDPGQLSSTTMRLFALRKSSEPATSSGDDSAGGGGSVKKTPGGKRRGVTTSSSTQQHGGGNSSSSNVNGQRHDSLEENLNGILRKDSVSSFHSPIGPAEAKMIQARQKRRVAVSFHGHEDGGQFNSEA